MAPRSFGTVRKTGEGRWSARYQNAGKKFSSPEPFAKESQAKAWLEKERALIRDGDWTPPQERVKATETATLTVAELIEKWIAGSNYKASTAQSHLRKINARVLRESIPGEFESLAPLAVVDVTRQRIRQWWTEVRAQWPEEKSTNATAYKRLHTAFEYAVHELEVIGDNPVKIKGAGKAPRPESRDRPLITLVEAQSLTEHAAPRLKAGVLLLFWSGLRIGELLELRRKDLIGLDSDDDTADILVRVARNVQRVTDEETGKQVMVVMETPKSDAGHRDIVLPASVAKALRKHAEEFMADGPETLVITTQAGSQMMDTNFRNRFKRLGELAGRPDISPHDARRFYGTLLVTEGHISLEEARRLMGHETFEQLLEYQRAAKGYEKRAATALDALIGSDRQEPELLPDDTEETP